MRKLKRILSLVLTSCIFIGMGSDIKAQAQTVEEIAKLEIRVNGKGTVIVDDGYSKYSLEDKDVLRANATVNSDLKLTVTPNDGYLIASVSGVDSQAGESGNSRIYDVSTKSDGTFIDVNFEKETKEEVNNEIKEETKDEVKEEKEDNNKSEISNDIEKELTEEIIINKYNDGIKMEENLIEARKKLATEKNLLDQVDENFFLTEEYLSNKSSADLMDEGVLILLNSLTNDEIKEFLTETNSNDEFIIRQSLIESRLFKRDLISNRFSFLNTRESLVVGNRGAITEYYNGYAHTAPLLSINGKQAFCVMFEMKDPSSGTIATNKRLANNDMLRKILYYGYNGPGTGGISSSWSSNQNLLMIATTQAASKANGHASYSLGNDFYNYVSGLATPPSGFKVYVVTTNGGATQDLAYWEFEQKGRLQISKESADPSITNGNNSYSLVGAEYGVYSNSSATNRVGTLTIGSNGWSNEIELDAGAYYIKETKAPKGYYLDKTTYPITVSAGSKATKTLKDKPKVDPIGILLRKVDADTGANRPQGSGSLADAHFTLKFYSGEYGDGVNPADLGKSPTRTWVVKTDNDGYTELNDSYKVSGDPFWYNELGRPTMPSGTLTIQETKAPVGYKINPEIFVKKIVPGITDNVSTYNEPIIKEDSLNFVIKKVQSGTSTLIPNAKFRHTKPDGSTEELTTGSNGEVIIRGLTQGTHRIVETQAPEGYEVNRNEFVFEVKSDNTIKVISNTTNMGMSYSTFEGDGILTVNDDVKPFSIRLTKVNDKGAILEGAEFTLYSDSACNNAIETQVSDGNGNLKFKNLRPGTRYYMKETKAPEGYRIPVDIFGRVHVYEIYAESTPVNNVFNYYIDGVKYTSNDTDSSKDVYLAGTKDDREVNMKVVNIIGMKLPKTGSWLMIPILLVGVGLMSYSVFSSKKKIKGDKGE
ncbi:hypothetical protein H8S20_16915 [Clostridium sp. NSJ-6]|uniref:Uncharacterized protein n=1 Tax=Clostridium hominis TaxID=2763036 RepID=A0ABR7DGK9_9CLOT|nr:SpaA isopeptide-forming pilin-related protein [Clostridium hominis]MBC5630540.1 hypothetical protein [Clostridium hominis]